MTIDLSDILTVGEEVEIIITGRVAGIAFEGCETIRVVEEALPGIPLYAWIGGGIGLGIIVLGLVLYVLWPKRAVAH